MIDEPEYKDAYLDLRRNYDILQEYRQILKSRESLNVEDEEETWEREIG